MRVRPSLLLVLATLGLTASSAHAQVWQTWVHSNGTITKFITSEIDSITFVFADTTQPGTPVIAAIPVDSRTIRVNWTAVGDDGASGTVATHDLRFATSPGQPFESMTTVSLAPPQPAGSAESVDVGSLVPGSTYWFVLRVTDDFGNTAVSNEASATTPPSGHLVISEVYGGGGQGGSYDHDFIEIFNPSDGPLPLADLTLQFAPTGATSWQMVGLGGGTVAPHRYFLVQFGSGGGGASLPQPDLVMFMNVTTAHGKVAIVESHMPFNLTCPVTPLIVDLLGFGMSDCFEGSGGTSPLGSVLSAQRLGGGCQDTNDNPTDFIVATPTPKNSASPQNPCP